MTSGTGASTDPDPGKGHDAQTVTVETSTPLSRKSDVQPRSREDETSVINPYKRPKTGVSGGSEQRHPPSRPHSAFSKPFTALLASGPPARPPSSARLDSGHRVHPPPSHMPPSRMSSSSTEPDDGGPAFTQYWGKTGPEVFRKLTSYCDTQIQAILQANWEQMARLQRETLAKLEGKDRVCQRRIEEKTDIWRSREMKLVQVIRSQVKMIDQLRAQLDEGDSILVVDKRRLTKCVREAVALGYQQAVDARLTMPSSSRDDECGGADTNGTPADKTYDGGASRGSASAGAAGVEARILPSSSPKRFVPAKLFDKEQSSAPVRPVERSLHASKIVDAGPTLPDWVEQSVFPNPIETEKPPATPLAGRFDGSTAIVLSPCSSPGVYPISLPSSPQASTAPPLQRNAAQTDSPRLASWVADYVRSEASQANVPQRPLSERPAQALYSRKPGFPTDRPLYTHQPLGQGSTLPQPTPPPRSQPGTPSQLQPHQPPASWPSAPPQPQPRHLPQTAVPGPGRQMPPPSDPFGLVQQPPWISRQSQPGQPSPVAQPSRSRPSTPQQYAQPPFTHTVDPNNAMYIRPQLVYPADQPGNRWDHLGRWAPVSSDWKPRSSATTPRRPSAPPAPR